MTIPELWRHVELRTEQLLKCTSERRLEEAMIRSGRVKHLEEHPRRVLPLPPISSRYYLQTEKRARTVGTLAGQAIRIATDSSILAASNNDYLLAYHDVPIASQIEQLQSEGIQMTLKSYLTLKEGKYWNIGLIMLGALALFWGEPLDRFLTQDYAHLKLKPINKVPPKNIRPRGSITAHHLRIVYNLAGKPCY
jgi:hypothetical protein